MFKFFGQIPIDPVANSIAKAVLDHFNSVKGPAFKDCLCNPPKLELHGQDISYSPEKKVGTIKLIFHDTNSTNCKYMYYGETPRDFYAEEFDDVYEQRCSREVMHLRMSVDHAKGIITVDHLLVRKEWDISPATPFVEAFGEGYENIGGKDARKCCYNKKGFGRVIAQKIYENACRLGMRYIEIDTTICFFNFWDSVFGKIFEATQKVNHTHLDTIRSYKIEDIDLSKLYPVNPDVSSDFQNT